MSLGQTRVALEIRRARKPLVALLGLIVLAVGSAAVIVGNLHLNLPWTDTYTARVAVDDAKGLVPNKQEVRIAGLDVGQVNNVELLRGRPVVTITMKRRYAPLYRDARLRVRPKTPLDDLYVDVEDRGHPSAGKLTGGEILSAERTRTPVDIGVVLNTFRVDTRLRVSQSIDTLGHALPDHGAQLRAALVQISPFLRAAQRLTYESATRRLQTRRLVHNFRLMTEELGRRDLQLTQLVQGGAATFTQLAAVDAPLSGVLTGFPPTLRQLESTFTTVRATADQLDPAFDALQPSARQLPAGLNALRAFSVEARPALAALRRPLPPLTALLRTLQPTARGLNDAFTRLSPQAPRLDRITGAVVPCELAVQKFFQNTISLGKFYDQRALIPRGQSVNGDDPNQSPSPSCAVGGPRK